MRLTKTTIEQLQLPDTGKKYDRIFRDDKLPGFCIRVTSNGAKTFIIDKKFNGKLKRIALGRYGQLTVDQARTEAQKILGKLASGTDPIQERKQQHLSNITFAEAFDEYLQARTHLKERTIYDYKLIMSNYLKSWHDKPLKDITKELVRKRYQEIGQRTQSGASSAIRVVSAVFNYTIARYEGDDNELGSLSNPVEVLSRTQSWYPTRRRRTRIENHQLASWYRAVMQLQNITKTSISLYVKHFLLLLLFTGLRREEALKLIWADKKSQSKIIGQEQHILDLTAKTVYIPDPKNHQEHRLPLPDYIVDLFTKYRQQITSDYVFPNATGTNHFKEPRKTMQQITDTTGISFTLHDLRRTFISIAESLDIPAYALKRMLNHKIVNSDVTAGYIVSDVDRLVAPMQKVADQILVLVNTES